MGSNNARFWRVQLVRSGYLLLIVVAASFCMLRYVAASIIDRPQLREGLSSTSSAMARVLMSTQTDTEALLQFRLQMESDPLGKLAGWNGSGGGGVCTWFGVSCASGRVAKVELREANLAGTALMVSSLITSLDKLQYLDLSGNKFHGNLSIFNSAKGSCGSLETIILASNSLTGRIPSDLLSCGTIKHLDLSHNSLSGDLPQDFFSHCGSLQVLDLSWNPFATSLPSSIALCSSLQLLNLSSNLLVGELPLDLLSPKCSSCRTETVPRLQTLDLSCNNLSGTISDTIFTRCGSLISIDLSSNSFSGRIPGSIENCNSLQQLNLSHNKLESRLPVFLGSLTDMRRLDISNNHLVGPIPPELGQLCLTLLHLDLSVNSISGTIPPSFASCYSLQTLNLTNNNLSGSFPEDIVSKLRNMENLMLAFNKFTGPMPVSVTSSSNLKVLDLSSNKITGQIPPDICHQSFSSLEKLLVSNNEIWGEVPAGLANCSQLKILDLSFNNLQGALPQELGSMSNLESLRLWSNGLTGEIPKRFGSLSNLRMLILNNNALSGYIPLELSNCTFLEWLCLSNNKLTGSIPPFIGRMPQLTIVELGNNSLSGSIPNEFANASKFLWLDLHSNSLSGPIPPGLGRHANGPLIPLSGVVFAFVRNLGTGCIGLGSLLEFGGITIAALNRAPMRTSCISRLYIGPSVSDYPDYSSVQVLDLSYNKLEGPIPDDIGSLQALQMLSLGHNQLVGFIPATFSKLRAIGVLDLSYNKLEGGIGPLANCSFLVQIDVSNNNLSGQIPSTGQLSTAPAAGFLNNSLCGEPLPSCGKRSDADTSDNCAKCISNNRLSVFPWSNSIVLAILISIALVCMIIVWAIMVRSKVKHKDTDLLGTLQASCHGNSSWNLGTDREPLSINVATFERPLRKLTFAQLVEATNGFSQESLIGIGGFGEVYKAELKDGSVVAIKKLLQCSCQGDREFTAEMETLGKIKHRNLVPLLGYCKVGEERLLVYEYMHGGSLDDMLHDEAGKEKLSWDLRKQIAKGAARGLAFLHHNCIPHIIHRDMKSSNVLLDTNLEARVSDFGMARLISALDTHLSVSTLAGTPGYVPPENYQSFRCSTKGDVYSFGVILLELLTGKRPTDKEEFEDSNLVGWVRQHLEQKKCMEVLDPHLKGAGAEHEMVYYLKIASDCLDDHPSRRPSMQQVVCMLKLELPAQELQN